MKTTTEYLMPNDKTLVITGEYNEYCRGSRDTYGVPLEPDTDAYFEILSTSIDGTEYTTDELAIMLNMTYEEVEELLQECLSSQDDSDYECYLDRQIDNYIESQLEY